MDQCGDAHTYDQCCSKDDSIVTDDDYTEKKSPLSLLASSFEKLNAMINIKTLW